MKNGMPNHRRFGRTTSVANWLAIRAIRRMFSLVPRALTKIYSIWVSLTYPFASIGTNLSIHRTCYLRNMPLMEIGNSVTIHEGVWIHAQLSPENTVPGTVSLRPDARSVIVLENRCYIGRRAHIDAKNYIHLEQGVLLSASTLIQDYSHENSDLEVPIRDQGTTKGGRIRIGKGCWIGHGAVIICENGELSLGQNCIVGANAVVTRSAPPYSVLAGNPARIVKQFDTTKGAWVLGSIRTADLEAGTSRQASSESRPMPSRQQ